MKEQRKYFLNFSTSNHLSLNYSCSYPPCLLALQLEAAYATLSQEHTTLSQDHTTLSHELTMLRIEKETLRDTVIHNTFIKNIKKDQQKQELENLKSALLKNSALKAENYEKEKDLSRMTAKYDDLLDHMEQFKLSSARSKETIERLRSDVSKTVN